VPVAAMVRELYAWLAEFDSVRSIANLSVRLSDEQMTALTLDPERYRAYEQAVVESVSRIGFDPSRLPVDSPLYDIHDAHWPPNCVRPDTAVEVRCNACQPEVAGAFERFEHLLRAAAFSGTDLAKDWVENDFPDGRRDWFLERLPDRVGEVLSRDQFDRCAYTQKLMADYLDQGLPDLSACFHEVTAEEIQRFFGLPYWKARWQLYEVWILHVVLRSYGATYWQPTLTDQIWDLKAGSTNRAPVATAPLKNRELRCYYQYESSPPKSMVPGIRDRPELLITMAHEAGQASAPGDDDESVILVVEAKAGVHYSTGDIKADIYALLEWEPKWILGASYFSLTGTEELRTSTVGGSMMALGERLVPDSKATTALEDWLRRMWVETCGECVTLIAVDVSRSMPNGAATSKLSAMATIAGDVNRPEWAKRVTASDRLCLATFGTGNARLFWIDDLTEDAVSPLVHHFRPTRGWTTLQRALNTWRAKMTRERRLWRRLDLHFVTDGHLGPADTEAIHQLDAAGHVVHVHLVEAGISARSEFKRYAV
jgi:hypothetical protein